MRSLQSLQVGSLALFACLMGCTGPKQEQVSAQDSPAPAAVYGCGLTETEDFDDYIRGNWQSASPTLQMLLVASDPQPFRIRIDGENEDRVDESRWRSTFSESYTSHFKQLRQGDYHVPLIINGDMSDYGHGNERDAFRKVIKKMGVANGPLMLPGLGNHDYANNVGKCAQNGCARDAVCDHITWVETILKRSTGLSFDHRRETRGGVWHYGSLAYSVDIGNVHVVQLNMEPTYAVNFESSSVHYNSWFRISQSMDWLEQDLKQAHARGKYSIVNMHQWEWADPSQRARFSKLINDHKVVGVFLGHLHGRLGFKERLGNVPIFFPGSLLARKHSRILFDWRSRFVQVNWYSNFDEKGELKYALDTLAPISPIAPPSVKVTLYRGKNYTGATCVLTLEVRDIKRLCPSFAYVPDMSMKVERYGGEDKLLCLTIPYTFSHRRCFVGTYKGNFQVPALEQSSPLPEGLRQVVTGTNIGYEQMTYND